MSDLPFISYPTLCRAALRIGMIASIVMLLSLEAAAQREYDIWYFGDSAGLDFSAGLPVPRNDSRFYSTEGGATICDPTTGRLLFYTNGTTVWNRNHQEMPNGFGLKGGDMNSSTQGALIVPMPCDTTKYYIFTADEEPYVPPPHEGINYSIVDMTRRGGLGDVTQKNVPLIRPAAEKLTAVRHANGRDYWVIAHSLGGSSFAAFHVSADGVARPVLSQVGKSQGNPATSSIFTVGQLKASPNGRKLALAAGALAFIELFDFDPATGIVSNPLVLDERDDVTGYTYYGISFSPDNSKLYASGGDAFNLSGDLVQFSLESNDPATMIGSKRIVAQSETMLAALQLGPDGRIYASRGTPTLGVVRNPNAAGVACDYDDNGVPLGRSSAISLPNNIDAGGARHVSCAAIDAIFELSQDTVCQNDCVTITDRTEGDPSSYRWLFEGGQPATSTSRVPPTVCYHTPGRYRVWLIVEEGSMADTAEQWITVRPSPQFGAHIESALRVIPGDTLTMPVVLDEPLDSSGVSSLRFSVRYDTAMLRLTDLANTDAMLRGTLLDGWSMTVAKSDPGIFTATFTAPPSKHLAGTGALLRLSFLSFVSWRDTMPAMMASQIPFELDPLSVQCHKMNCTPGEVSFTLCGARLRGIMMSSSKYSLATPSPNPVAASSTIRFSLGLDGETSLVVIDGSGHIVQRLIEATQLPSGEYEVMWDASDLPAGQYFYRLQSGHWGATGRALIVR